MYLDSSFGNFLGGAHLESNKTFNKFLYLVSSDSRIPHVIMSKINKKLVNCGLQRII